MAGRHPLRIEEEEEERRKLTSPSPGQRSISIIADVTKEEDIKNLVAKTVQELGELTVSFRGIWRLKPGEDLTFRARSWSPTPAS